VVDWKQDVSWAFWWTRHENDASLGILLQVARRWLSMVMEQKAVVGSSAQQKVQKQHALRGSHEIRAYHATTLGFRPVFSTPSPLSLATAGEFSFTHSQRSLPSASESHRNF
jgi:hypothetical protein